MLIHIKEKKKKTIHVKMMQTKTKPNKFHDIFCKIGIELEGLARVTPNTVQNMAIAKICPSQQFRGSVANIRIRIAEFKMVEYLTIPQMPEELINMVKITTKILLVTRTEAKINASIPMKEIETSEAEVTDTQKVYFTTLTEGIVTKAIRINYTIQM